MDVKSLEIRFDKRTEQIIILFRVPRCTKGLHCPAVMKLAVFWVVAPCRRPDDYHPDDGGSTDL
jgi:hypothetical protein